MAEVLWRWSNSRPPRAWLFVPADRATDRLEKAVGSGADAVIVDLEDGVAPSDRGAARRALGPAIASADRSVPIFVRINALDEADAALDIEAVAGLPIAGVVVPKCEDPDVVERLRGAWPGARAEPPAVVALLETPAGILASAAIARSDPTLVAIAFGAEDLAQRTGMRRTPEGLEILVARSLVVLAAAAAGIWSLDTPSLELVDLAAVERDARQAAVLGFSGKLVVHPRQIGPVRSAFRPAPQDLDLAREIVAASDARGRRSDGAATAGGRMVDRPIVEAARRLLAGDVPDTEDEQR